MTGSAPRISVLLPCRDAAAYLPEAMASLEAQSFADFEVIAVDDGSVDASPDLLHEWAGRDPRVRVLARPAGGIAAALETAAAAATGEYLARMDADDVAGPERLKRQLAYMEARRALAACGTRVRYFPRATLRDGARRYEAWLNALSAPDEIARDIFVECPVAHPTLMVRHRVFEAVGGYRDMGWPEDYDLILRLWADGHDLGRVPEVLHHWRDRGDRASRTLAAYSADAFRRCKVHFLRRTLLAGREGAVVWGAGPTGKRFGRQLLREGVRLLAFIDLDPRKIGQSVYGAPVLPPDGVDRHRDAFVLAAVGSAAGRAQIRSALRDAGRTEMVDFCAVA